MFNRKKKIKEEPIEEEEIEEEPDEEEDALPTDDVEKVNKILSPKAKHKAEPVQEQGEFTLNGEEMGLAITALAERDEYKLYVQVMVGKKIADMIEAYKAVKKE